MTLPDSLSAREKEVAALLLQGKSNKQIAQALGVATRTVEFHLSNIFEKLAVTSRAEAIICLSEPPVREPLPLNPAAEPDLRESTGLDLREPAADLRASTVAKTAASSENDGNFVIPVRRITMRKMLFFIGLVLVACVALSALCVLLTYPAYQFSGGKVPSPAVGIFKANDTPVQPTVTPIQPTPMSTSETPAQAEPTGVIPRAFESGAISYEGLSLSLDPSLAGGANGMVLLEQPPSDQLGWFQVYPQYARLTLRGYAITGSAHEPVIAVYPVEEYRRLSQQAAQQIDTLKALLAQSAPINVDAKLPLLPLTNAGQIYRSNVQRLNFQNGSGVRFLALYAQYPAPVNSYDLFYTYQGLTADGRHVVSVILPVSHPSLPVSADAVSQREAEALIKDPGYYRQTADRLSADTASSFAPDLAKLDALVTSIKIDR